MKSVLSRTARQLSESGIFLLIPLHSVYNILSIITDSDAFVNRFFRKKAKKNPQKESKIARVPKFILRIRQIFTKNS